MNPQPTAPTRTSPQAQARPSAVWDLDPAHSSASFSVRHMMIAKVRGGFTRLSGTLLYDPGNPSQSAVETAIDASSIDTREPKRDEHLRSADFLDVSAFPSISFRSKRVERDGDGLRVTGDLTLHGVTREVALEVEGMGLEVKDPWGHARVGASATTSIKRRDFGLTWNAALETGGVLVGDDVSITLDVQFVRRPV